MSTLKKDKSKKGAESSRRRGKTKMPTYKNFFGQVSVFNQNYTTKLPFIK